ncbi:hypothetical protein SB781_32990, partial [Paraburkholderia sp. SIMBA_061]
DLFPDKRLRDAEKRYLKLLRNQSEEAATALQGTPDKLRREATALLIGETLRESPAARARLMKQAPTLAQRVLEALRQIRQRITGKQDTLDRIIEEFEQGLGAPTQ